LDFGCWNLDFHVKYRYMRKGLLALPAIFAAGLLPWVASAADVCNRVSGKGLFDGVCQECFDKGQCQIADFFIVGNSVVKIILGLSGSVMLLMVIYGGFIWLVSNGNSSMVDKGRNVLIGAVIGLIIVFGAYTAIQFLVAALACNGSSSCTVVDEIFARPFQAVKQPNSEKKPAASTGNQTPSSSGNPTAGQTGSAAGSCKCRGSFSDKPGQGQIIKETTCGLINSKGLSCQWQSTACICAESPVSAITDKDSCNWDAVMNKLGIPSLSGVNASGICSWSE
jgi:hypothetical protein